MVYLFILLKKIAAPKTVENLFRKYHISQGCYVDCGNVIAAVFEIQFFRGTTKSL